MALSPLFNILNQIQRKPAWQSYHRYSAIVTHWQSVVPTRFAQKTRPMAIRRQILWVGTESSAIAQHLFLQRYTILKQLNRLLDEPLSDIHFSSAHWTVKSPKTDSEDFKFSLNPVVEVDDHQEPTTMPEEAFERWADVIRQRTQKFPLCPYCQSPLLSSEWERWSMCGYCYYRQDLENSV